MTAGIDPVKYIVLLQTVRGPNTVQVVGYNCKTTFQWGMVEGVSTSESLMSRDQFRIVTAVSPVPLALLKSYYSDTNFFETASH